MTKTYTGYEGESFTDEDAKVLLEGLYGAIPTATDNHEASTSATADVEEPPEETSS